MSNFTEMYESPAEQNATNTYSLSGTLCTPKSGAKNSSHVQYLIHGVGFDSSYWDFAAAPEYSYVRAAADAGYTTFRFDRLGTGLSQKPSDAYKYVHPLCTHVPVVADGRCLASCNPRPTSPSPSSSRRC